MTGIPPLAADLVMPEVAVEQPAEELIFAEPETVAVQQSPVETVETAPAVAPAAAPVAAAPVARKIGRRLSGPSNAPLLVAAPVVAAVAAPTETPAAPQVASEDTVAPAVQQESMTPSATPNVMATPAKGRRLSGASNVPLLVAVPHPVLETESAAAPQAEPTLVVESEPAAVAQTPTDAAQPAAPVTSAPAGPVPSRRLAAPTQAQSQAQAPAPAVTKSKEKKETPRGLKLGLQIAAVAVVAVILVLVARWLRETAGVQNFITQYDGHSSQPLEAPSGIPTWLAWQHYLNMFFMVLIVRSGLQVRLQKRPPGYWTAKQNSFFSPGKQPPKKISLTQWFHQLLDVLWVINGALFIVALLVTGYWMRIVPTSWDVFPNMLSAALQYVSLDWPDENGWIHYNALQLVAYFLTVFIAAPLAIISGLRMSTWWPANNARLAKIYPVEVARAIHIPVMVYFVGFTLVHVFLVFFTGALRNLNHMFTTRDEADLWGLLIFALSVVVIAAAWFLTSPMFLRPLAGTMGKISKN